MSLVEFSSGEPFLESVQCNVLEIDREGYAAVANAATAPIGDEALVSAASNHGSIHCHVKPFQPGFCLQTPT